MTEHITFSQLHWQVVTSSNSSLILLLLIVLEATQQRFVNALTAPDIDMSHTQWRILVGRKGPPPGVQILSISCSF